MQSCCNPGPRKEEDVVVMVHTPAEDVFARRLGSDCGKMGRCPKDGMGNDAYVHPPCRGEGVLSYSGSKHAEITELSHVSARR